jgi:hypothetical protein
MISTYTQKFSWKEMTEICKILEGKKFQISKFLCHYCQARDDVCIFWKNTWWVVGTTTYVGLDRDYCIRSNFWKFYLIKIAFTLDEIIFLVKMFRLFRLEWIVLVFRVWTQWVMYNILSIGKISMFVMPCSTWLVYLGQSHLTLK